MSFRNPTQRGRNLQPTGGIRIDARVGEAKQFGLRNTHRAGNGEIIGGEDSDGKPFGTKAGPRPIDGSTLGNPSTPGLDRLRAMNPNAKPSDMVNPGYLARDMKAKQDARPTIAAAPGSQLLKDRQNLYADMQGTTNPTAQDLADREARAKKLGVTGSSFRKVASDLAKKTAQKPASSFMAAVGGRMPVQDGVSLPGQSALRQPAASPPASPQAPIPGGLPVAPAPVATQPVKPVQQASQPSRKPSWSYA
jgi:hypothetical protein